MKTTLSMPRVSMNMEEGTITAWHKREGESFAKGEPLYDIETEKVISEVEAPSDGTLCRILVPVDATAEVGSPVCEIETG